jgi:hypothetical protein
MRSSISRKFRTFCSPQTFPRLDSQAWILVDLALGGRALKAEQVRACTRPLLPPSEPPIKPGVTTPLPGPSPKISSGHEMVFEVQNECRSLHRAASHVVMGDLRCRCANPLTACSILHGLALLSIVIGFVNGHDYHGQVIYHRYLLSLLDAVRDQQQKPISIIVC